MGSPPELLDAAERLIAERGVEAVSLREVGAAAGHRNNSAAQYHFGSKSGLLAAVFERRMGPINARRLELLRSVEPGDVRGLVDAWWRPFAEAVLVDPPTGYARFTAQAMSHPAFVTFRAARLPVTEGLEDVMARLGAAVPAAADADVRLSLAGIAAAHRFAHLERVGPPMPSVDHVLAELVDALAGLLTAPVLERTTR